MQWFRLYSEFSTDPKVQSMSEAMQRRLIMLMCFKNQNLLQTYSDKDISFAMRISAKECQKMKSVFRQRNFIDENWNLLNWDKRQFPSDSSTKRVRRYREAQRNVSCNVSETFQERYCNGLDTDTDTDKKEKTKKEKKISPSGVVSQARRHSNVDQIFECWKTTFGHAKAKLNDKTKRKILQALKSFDTVDLLDAIGGCKLTPWNMGQNPNNQIYDGIDLIFRNDDQIRRFITNNKSKSSTGGKYELWKPEPSRENTPEEKKAIEEIIQKTKQKLKFNNAIPEK